MKKFVMLHLVRGNEGYCLNLDDKDGNGYRIAGNKPWGNPTNIPTASFKVDYAELVRLGEDVAFEDEEDV